MYRFFLLVCFIGAVYSLCQETSFQWTPTSHQQPEKKWTPNFESLAFEIAQGFIALDRKIQAFCHSYADHDLTETHGIDYYGLSLHIPGFIEDNISVQVKHRIVFVTVEDCSRTYANVKILPEGVDAKSALWKYSQGELLIRFPYKISLRMQSVSTCGQSIDESVVVVQKYIESLKVQNPGDGSGWYPRESSGGPTGWDNVKNKGEIY